MKVNKLNTKCWMLGCCLFICLQLTAQDPNASGNLLEQQLENQAEADESETEDDSYAQQLDLLAREPLNLNTVTESELQVFRFLNPVQISSLLQYRKLLGNFLSVYELQAVPNWDIETINRIKPFVKVSGTISIGQDFRNRFLLGQHSLVVRWSQTLEQAKGFQSDDTPPAYAGSPARIFTRYKYQYKNLLQFGAVGEKDPGEQFFKGNQLKGFDFYSAHLFFRNIGKVRQLALGDFTVNMGQGLLVYQSLAFRKSADVMNIKRQSELFRPYNSAGEFNFFRGAAINYQWGRLSTALFGAYQKISSNAYVDTTNFETVISSILTGGLHRTSSEILDKNNTSQTTVGGSVQYRTSNLHWGLNAMHYQLGKALQKADYPYNQFTFSGKSLTGVSTDWGYTYKNYHFFGEFAHSINSGKALVAGFLSSLNSQLDLSLLYRNIDKNYHSLYSNAFTEGTTPINEKGLFMGLAIKPTGTTRIDMYADMFQFSWLRFRVDRPSTGREYLVQFTWKPNKQFEIYSRFRQEVKAINATGNMLPFNQTFEVPRYNWRTHFSYKISPSLVTRSRLEYVWFDRGGPQAEEGYLLFWDLIFKPMLKPLSGSVRLQYFDTDGFNSRIYAYENDVLYSYSIPPFFYKGYRAYLNINYDFTRKLACWFRIAQTRYTNREVVGSGNDEISGNHRTDFRIQLRYLF